MACLRVLRYPFLGRSLWQRTSVQCRLKSSHSSDLSGRFFDQPEKLQRLRELVKSTLPYAVDDVYHGQGRRGSSAESSSALQSTEGGGSENEAYQLLSGEGPVTRRYEMSQLLRDCFEDKVKSIDTVVLRTCYFGAAVVPEPVIADLNSLWVVYSMQDGEFLDKHLWLSGDVRRCRPVVYDGWLHMIEMQDFLRMVLDGKLEYAEALFAPYANRIMASKDWSSFSGELHPISSQLATPRFISELFKQISKLRGEVRNIQKSDVQGTPPPMEAVIRWAAIFRLLHNFDNAISTRPLVGFEDLRTDVEENKTEAPFLDNKVEVWVLQGYRDGIMSDSDLDRHLQRMVALHGNRVGDSAVAPSRNMLQQVFSFVLQTRVEGWSLEEETLTAPPAGLRLAIKKQLEDYYGALLVEQERKAAQELKEARATLDKTIDAIDAKHQKELVEIKPRIALMDEVWGDEKVIALDQVLDKHDDAKRLKVFPLEQELKIKKEDVERHVRFMRCDMERLQEMVDQMHVLAMVQWKPDTSFVLFCYPVGQQVVSASLSACQDDSDIFSGIHILSDKPAARRILACDVHWFLRNLPHEPTLVDVFLSHKEYVGPEFKNLVNSMEGKLLSALCRNLCKAAQDAAEDGDISVGALQKLIVKMRQARDLLARKGVDYPLKDPSLPQSVSELKPICAKELEALASSSKQQLGNTDDCDVSAISDWMRSNFKLTPVKQERIQHADVSKIDKWLMAGVPQDVRKVLEVSKGQSARFIAPNVHAEDFLSVVPWLYDGIFQMQHDGEMRKIQLPEPPLPPEKPVFSYLEWRLIRKRRRQEDRLAIRARTRGKVGRFGRKVLPRNGWFVGQRRRPVVFDDCYDPYDDEIEETGSE